MTNLLLLSDDGSSIVIILLLIIFFALYLWLCYEVGKYAQKRGRDFWLFFFLSLIINPIIGYIIAALIGESDAIREEQIRNEVKKALEQERNQQQQNAQETEE